ICVCGGPPKYAMVCYRFDLAYAVFDKSTMSNSVKQQWDAEKWICDYLRGTAKLQCHGDAEFGGDLVPRRSTTGNADCVFTLAECIDSWKMVLHEMLVSSTIEAEHMAVAGASVKALRWQGLVRNSGGIQFGFLKIIRSEVLQI